VAVVQVVLSDSLSADRARAMGLDARDYAAGEQITVEQRYADGLTRAGYTAPVGAAATVVYGGMDPSIPAFIRQTSGTYPTRASVTLDPARPVVWIGATAPTVGGSYAISGVDVWIQG
jgi:hypothetical protein